MPLFDDHPMTELDKKAHELLGEKVVIKSLASQAALQRLPRYVSEYLIAKYVKPDTWQADLANIQAKIKELLQSRSNGNCSRKAPLPRERSPSLITSRLASI